MYFASMDCLNTKMRSKCFFLSYEIINRACINKKNAIKTHLSTFRTILRVGKVRFIIRKNYI